MKYNYNYGDGGIVDETSAEFKAQSDAVKAKKKESVEIAMQYNYNYGDGGIVDETSAEFKALGDKVKAAKRESVETAMQYNYNYGDGGVVDETSAEFKALGDNIKAAKRESVGKFYNTHLHFILFFHFVHDAYVFCYPPSTCLLETAMQYNYNYGDGGVVDETSAEFKKLQEQRKAAKKESVGE